MAQEPATEKKAELQHEEDAAYALLAATAQIGVALHESRDPVAELGALLTHLVESLSALRTAPLDPGADGAMPAEVARGLIEQLQSEVFKGIQQLQFYDRMVQHLSHLQEYMISIANELGPMKAGRSNSEVWNEMHAKLRERLISDEQRGLLDVFLSPHTPTRVSAQAAGQQHSPPGTFELF